jgi:hypothetical protein
LLAAYDPDLRSRGHAVQQAIANQNAAHCDGCASAVCERREADYLSREQASDLLHSYLLLEQPISHGLSRLAPWKMKPLSDIN